MTEMTRRVVVVVPGTVSPGDFGALVGVAGGVSPAQAQAHIVTGDSSRLEFLRVVIGDVELRVPWVEPIREAEHVMKQVKSEKMTYDRSFGYVFSGPCPVCEAASGAGTLSNGTEMEQTTAGVAPDHDGNRYTFGVKCVNGHKYSVVMSNGRKA